MMKRTVSISVRNVAVSIKEYGTPATNTPVVIVAHGLPADHPGQGTLHKLATYLASDYRVVVYDAFETCGALGVLSARAHELAAVIAAYSTALAPNGIIGVSHGALVVAATNSNKVCTSVLWSPVTVNSADAYPHATRQKLFRPVQRPVLVLHGSEDEQGSGEAMQDLMVWLPHESRLVVVEGAKHLLWNRSPVAIGLTADWVRVRFTKWYEEKARSRKRGVL